MIALPNFRREQTGNVQLDRIQGVVSDLVEAVRALARAVPDTVSLSLRSDFQTTSADPRATGLRFAVKAGETWNVEVWGNAACSSVAGVAYAIGAPTNSTVSGWIDTSSTNTAVANWLVVQLTAPNVASAACHAGASNSGRPDRITVRVTAAADGFVDIMFSSITSGTTSILSALAYMRATRARAV